MNIIMENIFAQLGSVNARHKMESLKETIVT